VFAIHDKVVEDILASVQEQQALEAAPKILDALQQTVITVLRGYLNSPSVARSDIRAAMQRLRQPMSHTAIRELRRGYERFQQNQDIQMLVALIPQLVQQDIDSADDPIERQTLLTKEDLHLVCFDFVWS